jgi:hypothetical protein
MSSEKFNLNVDEKEKDMSSLTSLFEFFLLDFGGFADFFSVLFSLTNVYSLLFSSFHIP